MSAIDTTYHFRIGEFLRVPLYQPLGNAHLVHRNPQDGHRIPQHLMLVENVRPGVLVLGGGSGEHPAIIFHDPDHCVARYLEYCLQLGESAVDQTLKTACENMQGDLQTIEYCDWTNQNHIDFRERCAYAFRHFKEEMRFEAWLLMSIGEFVFHLIPTFSPRIQSWHKNYTGQTFWFKNVQIPYDTYCGNGKDRFKIVDTELDELPGMSAKE